MRSQKRNFSDDADDSNVNDVDSQDESIGEIVGEDEKNEEDIEEVEDDYEDIEDEEDLRSTSKIKSVVGSNKKILLPLIVILAGYMLYSVFSDPDIVTNTNVSDNLADAEIKKTGKGNIAEPIDLPEEKSEQPEQPEKSNLNDDLSDIDLPPLDLGDEYKDVVNIPSIEFDKNSLHSKNQEKESQNQEKIDSDDALPDSDIQGPGLPPSMRNTEEPISLEDQQEQDPAGINEVNAGSNVIDSSALTIEDKRRSSMFVLSGSGPREKRSQKEKKSDFIIIEGSSLSMRKPDERSDAVQVGNLDNSLLEGKIINAVLETAINTQVPGNIRAIVSSDVYSETGGKILIPKGSRLYGSYSSNIQKGQSRVQVNCSRLVRPDGVSIRISAEATDQFGRAGLEGNVDNRIGDSIASAIMVSMTSLGIGLLTQQLTGNTGQTQVVNPNGTFTTTNITPLNYAAQSAIQTASDLITNLTQGAMSLSPIVTLPQGTKMKIILSQDLKIPTFKQITID